MDVIEIKDLSKRFIIPYEKETTLFEHLLSSIRRQYSCKEIWALQDINLRVKRGECLGIIGANGSGKTTLLKILARVIQPTAGKVKVVGKVMSLIELGLGFQSELTGRENVYLYGSILGMSKKDIDKKIGKIFRFAQIEKYANAKLKCYSSGMKIRLGFATSIFTNPDILLLDEVLSVGDLSFQRKSLNKMKEFKEQGKTIVFVSHGLSPIKSVCDKVILLEQGRIEKQGKTEDIVDYYMNKVFLGDRKELKEEIKEGKKELSRLKEEKSKVVENIRVINLTGRKKEAEQLRENLYKIAHEIEKVEEDISELSEEFRRFITGIVEETENSKLKRKLIDELKEVL